MLPTYYYPLHHPPRSLLTDLHGTLRYPDGRSNKSGWRQIEKVGNPACMLSNMIPRYHKH